MNFYTKVAKKLDLAVSFFLTMVAISIVLFMLSQLVFMVGALFHNVMEVIAASRVDRVSIVNKLNLDYLHSVALIILLVKAYKILMSYADDHHVDIRYMIEIAIIGSILELLFNSGDYSSTMQLVFAVLGLGSAILYHYWYPFEGSKMLQEKND